MSRIPPPDVPPIEHGGLMITAENAVSPDATSFTASIQAVQLDTNAVEWKTNLYTIARTPELEGDVQDVFLAKMELIDGYIMAESEKGDAFYLDPATGAFANGSSFKSINSSK